VSLAALPLALAALMPVMVGPLPSPGPEVLTAQLCNGGTVTIPLGKPKAPDEKEDCHPKGCHAGNCRERDISSNLISRKDAL
jgi:hypothetical protein